MIKKVLWDEGNRSCLQSTKIVSHLQLLIGVTAMKRTQEGKSLRFLLWVWLLVSLRLCKMLRKIRFEAACLFQ